MEKGVDIWVKDSYNNWSKGLVKNINNEEDEKAQIEIQYANGRIQKISANIREIENTKHQTLKLANNYDMVRL